VISPERKSYSDVVLVERLRNAVDRINPDIPREAKEEAIKKVLRSESPQNNEFLAVNQFTVLENNNNRRPDIIIFINGLPLVVIELKNPADENATIWTAFNQIETYKTQIPSLFHYNAISVISDGIEARAGTITSIKNWLHIINTTLSTKQLMQRSKPQAQGVISAVVLSGIHRVRVKALQWLFRQENWF
jgi:type I restriction enzyme R subunit